MKYLYIILLTPMLYIVTTTDCQAQTEAVYRQEETKRINDTKKAFDQFLNGSLSEAARLEAVRSYSLVNDPAQLNELKKVVRNTSNSAQIRATALSKMYAYVDEDNQMFQDISGWLLDTNTTLVLRREALNTVGSVSFTAFGMQSLSDQLLVIYRQLINDPVPEFRQNALNYLALHKDDVAQQRLIDGLQDSGKQVLPPAESIALLSYDIHGDYYPVIHNVLKNTNDKQTRIEAIKVLGNFQPAKEEIVGYMLNDSEDNDIRMAALKSINAFDKEGFSNYAKQLFEGNSTPDIMLIYAINAEKYRRIALPKVALEDKSGLDPFDQGVKSLLDKNNTRDVQSTVVNYMETLGIE